MAVKWNNGADMTAVDIRPGGPGNNWQILDIDASVDAPTGGARARTTKWGRGEKSGLTPRGFFYTGNPADWSFNAAMRLRAQNFLKRLDCSFDLRVRQRCDRPDDLTAYSEPGIIGLMETTNNGKSYSDPAASMDGVSADMKVQSARVATQEELYTKLAHDDISKTWSDVKFNRVISVGVRACAGDCGDETTEEDKFWAVTDRDTAPLYTGNPAPWFYYTVDKGANWTGVRIDTLQSADADDVVWAGPYVLVFSADKAPTYARYQDILDGVVAPNLWAVSTGFTGITTGNFPRAAAAVSSSLIFAVGNGGRIWKSTDGGITFTLIDNAATTAQNLNAISFQDETLGYIGGNAGVLLRYKSGTISVVRVVDASGNVLAANINTVRTPPDRGREVLVGTAGGEIWRSKNATSTVPVFTNMSFVRKGEGSIVDLGFTGYRGDVLYVVQNDINGNSRVLRDFSGGALGPDVEVIGSFTAPSNFGIVSIAPANVNFAITVGNVHENYAFVGQIHPVN